MNPLNQTQQRILHLKQKFYALLSCLLHISYLFKNIYSIRKKQYLQKKANKIYEMVTTNRKQILTDNSCDFHILEAGYREYVEKVLKKL